MQDLYIGLMSGTSMDGLDIALVDFSEHKCKLIGAETVQMPQHLSHRVEALWKNNLNLNDYGATDMAIGAFFAASVQQFLEKRNIAPSDITAIGSHGQTLWHAAEQEQGFTLQIGNPHMIAARTQIDVVADFRQADMVRGGQGAPLAPAFHDFVFAVDHKNRAIVNLGGIANVTLLRPKQKVLGWDTGPANTLMDIWIARHKDLAYDKDGLWAGTGHMCKELLDIFCSEAWLALSPPKSTGRELFHMEWLEQKLSLLGKPIAPCDVQATLLAFTAHSLINSLAAFDIDEMFLCGGGAHNKALVAYIQKRLPLVPVGLTNDLGIDADYLEAMIFAWYAKQFKEGRKASLPAVTGADAACVLGALFPASSH